MGETCGKHNKLTFAFHSIWRAILFFMVEIQVPGHSEYCKNSKMEVLILHTGK